MGSQESAFDPAAVTAELEQILASKTFHNADRLSRFLRYIIDQTLAGAASDIKEYSIGIEVFGRGADFDSRSDSVVRVEARRLRTKLRDYYDTEGVDDSIVIRIPKGSYIPELLAADGLTGRPAPSRKPTIWPVAAATVLLAFFGGWLIGHKTGGGVSMGSIAVLPLENLSSDPGNENFCHALSDQVAAQLSAGGKIHVQTRGASGPFNPRADLRELAAKGDAGYALEGSASFAGDHVRVTVMLVELRRFSNVWLETYDRDLRDLLATESDLAGQIAQGIRQRMP